MVFLAFSRHINASMIKRNLMFFLILPAVFILLVGGIVPSIILNDWGWFSRSGSLLTAYGVMVTYADFSGRIEKWSLEILPLLDKKKRRWQKGLQKKLEAKFDKPIVDEMLNDETIKRMLDMIPLALQDWLQGLSTRFRIIEISMIICGTIIWGYGDLIPDIYSLFL